MSRGIYLVANKKSQSLCASLIYSIREAGCSLPIRLIHFGGKKIQSKYIKENVELLTNEDFGKEANDFIMNLASVLSDAPKGFLYRYLGFFSDWDAFIYSDNDVVALTNWEKLFDFLQDNNLVNADEEYTTQGRYNHDQPGKIKALFGDDALEKAVTAGHFLIKNDKRLLHDFNMAVNWVKQNSGIVKTCHEQGLLHLAILLGNWRMVNLCKPPYNWLSSWAGDYKNVLDLIQKINVHQSGISHLHYSGRNKFGHQPIDELLFSNMRDRSRFQKILSSGLLEHLGINYLLWKKKRAVSRLNTLLKK